MKRSQPHAPKDPYFRAVNPKDLIAQGKLDLSLIPETAIIDEALAFYEGAQKYGRFNWRMKRVKMSVYLSALMRHYLKLLGGEKHDRKTMVGHLAYIRCCAGILIDADYYGSLVDDRPPRGIRNPDISRYLDEGVTEVIANLQQLFKRETPKQYTIADVYAKERRSQRRSRARR